jgi:hypothetical protein
VRPLAPAAFDVGHALVRATQDLDHLLPGESALLTLEVATEGRRVPFEVKGAELLLPKPGAPGESVASVAFRDDGAAPDRTAGDGVATARVPVPPHLKAFDGELRVRAEVSAGSETGEVFYPLFVSSAVAATLTGTVREVVENGSLAFYAGIRVKKTGRYAFTGRVYDSEHRAMAVLTASETLDPQAREIRLTLCGALLRDEAIVGPWELRDVEGLYIVQNDDRVDRIPIATWNGPHRTREYPLETFSDAAAAEKTEPSKR